MKIVIVDDEARTRKSIANLIRLSNQPNLEVVAEAEDVETGYDIVARYKPDIVLLDINMPDGTGFDLLKKIDNPDFKVIFITAYEEFAVKAFEFSAIDYILKPVDPQKLFNAIDKVHKLVEQENISLKLNALYANLENESSVSKKLVLKTAENIYIINTNDIIRCESDAGYTKFFLVDGKKVLVSKTLKDYEELLSGFGFCRIHQSHMVNIKYVDHYSKTNGGAVVMKDDSELPVARRKKESFLKLLEII